MSRRDPRGGGPHRGRAARRPVRRRSRAGAVVGVLAAAAAALLLLGDDSLWSRIAPTSSDASGPAVAEPVDVTVDDILTRGVENPDGSITLTLTEAETAGLVRAGLSRNGAPLLQNMTVDLVAPDGSAPGQMELAGRLSDQPLPVNATVDLNVTGGRAEPSARTVRVGPLQVPESTREQLNAQLRDVTLLAVEGVLVDDLRTTESRLVITGRRG